MVPLRLLGDPGVLDPGSVFYVCAFFGRRDCIAKMACTRMADIEWPVIIPDLLCNVSFRIAMKRHMAGNLSLQFASCGTATLGGTT